MIVSTLSFHSRRGLGFQDQSTCRFSPDEGLSCHLLSVPSPGRRVTTELPGVPLDGCNHTPEGPSQRPHFLTPSHCWGVVDVSSIFPYKCWGHSTHLSILRGPLETRLGGGGAVTPSRVVQGIDIWGWLRPQEGVSWTEQWIREGNGGARGGGPRLHTVLCLFPTHCFFALCVPSPTCSHERGLCCCYAEPLGEVKEYTASQVPQDRRKNSIEGALRHAECVHMPDSLLITPAP